MTRTAQSPRLMMARSAQNLCVILSEAKNPRISLLPLPVLSLLPLPVLLFVILIFLFVILSEAKNLLLYSPLPLPLLSLLPLPVLAVILSEAKDPDTLHPTTTVRPFLPTDPDPLLNPRGNNPC